MTASRSPFVSQSRKRRPDGNAAEPAMARDLMLARIARLTTERDAARQALARAQDERMALIVNSLLLILVVIWLWKRRSIKQALTIGLFIPSICANQGCSSGDLRVRQEMAKEVGSVSSLRFSTLDEFARR